MRQRNATREYGTHGAVAGFLSLDTRKAVSIQELESVVIDIRRLEAAQLTFSVDIG